METTDNIIALVVGIACASVLVVEISGIMGWIKSKMFKRLKSCWKLKYTNAEVVEMRKKGLLKETGASERVSQMMEQVRRVPLWLRPFRLTKKPVPPSAWQPEAVLHFKPFACIPCFSFWAGVNFSLLVGQFPLDYILLIGGTPIAALIITKIIQR